MGLSDIVFMHSRDGLHFDRRFMEAFVRPGRDQGNWHERAIEIGPGEEIYGDQLERVVTWKNGSDLSALAHRTIRLRFVLQDADLYSFRFRFPTPTQAEPTSA
jgi:hypothetical protein